MSERDTPSLAEVIALLPCPFCGEQPEPGWSGSSVPGMEDCGYAYIEHCDVHVHRDTMEEAITAWNTRTSAASLRDEDARDAARYRFLRKELLWAYAGHGDVRWSFVIQMPMPDIQAALADGSVSLQLDAAVDAATQPAAQERQ